VESRVDSDGDVSAVAIILDGVELRIIGGIGGVECGVWHTLAGRPLADLLPGDDADAVVTLIAGVGVGDACQLSLDLQIGDRRLPLVAEVARLGTCIFIRGTERDLEADVVSEERLVQHRLEELGVLVSGIAHDFNNILSAILGNAEFLADAVAELSAADGELASAVADIMTAADRSRELIAQMLGYASRKRSAGRTVLDIGAITAEMGRLLRASIPPQVSLHFASRGALPPVFGDASQLRQVIMNLIVNAADAISEVGTITIRSGTMYADATLLSGARGTDRPVEGDYVFVEFEDTGCGMTAATLERIFDPFFTTKSKGRGLGLAGVRAIVASHGGHLLINSTLGIGTTFRLLLPVSTAALPRDVREPGASGTALAGLRVLVIDDEQMVLRVGARVLSARGALVTSAADGHQGLELFAGDPTALDCAIVNVAMPFIDGIEVAHELRALRSDLPILFISGYGREEIERRIADLPGVGFLGKPFSSGQLVVQLRELLDRADVTAG
jgi:two-component system cell cycle sensor histidine kinase/response regulator CckA